MNTREQFLSRRAKEVEGMLQEALTTLEQSVEAMDIVSNIACAFAFDAGRGGLDAAAAGFEAALTEVRAESEAGAK